jgi:hypothetical protein
VLLGIVLLGVTFTFAAYLTDRVYDLSRKQA